MRGCITRSPPSHWRDSVKNVPSKTFNETKLIVLDFEVDNKHPLQNVAYLTIA